MATLLYFAGVREAIGFGEEQAALPPEAKTPRKVADWLSQRGQGYAAAFADPSRLRCAVDQVMTPLDAPLCEPNEIAFFPPVTGG